RPVLLLPGQRLRRRAQALAARRTGDHRPQPLLSGIGRPAPGAARTRLRLARHRYPPLAAGGLELHRDHRGPAGAARVLSRGDRLPKQLDRRRSIAGIGRTSDQEWLRALSSRPARSGIRRMEIVKTRLPGCLVVQPQVFGDARGQFFESFNLDKLAAHGFAPRFVQGNVSTSTRGVLRGLHYQWPKPQGKYVSVVDGEVWDVAVDIRRGSPTFGE